MCTDAYIHRHVSDTFLCTNIELSSRGGRKRCGAYTQYGTPFFFFFLREEYFFVTVSFASRKSNEYLPGDLVGEIKEE